MKKEIVQVPFVAHESAMNRMERTNKRLSIIAIIELIVILLMFAGIMVYFYLPTEVEETTTSGSQDITDVENSNINQSVGDK